MVVEEFDGAATESSKAHREYNLKMHRKGYRLYVCNVYLGNPGCDKWFFSDEPITQCPNCGHHITIVLAPPAKSAPDDMPALNRDKEEEQDD